MCTIDLPRFVPGHRVQNVSELITRDDRTLLVCYLSGAYCCNKHRTVTVVLLLYTLLRADSVVCCTIMRLFDTSRSYGPIAHTLHTNVHTNTCIQNFERMGDRSCCVLCRVVMSSRRPPVRSVSHTHTHTPRTPTLRHSTIITLAAREYIEL